MTRTLLFLLVFCPWPLVAAELREDETRKPSPAEIELFEKKVRPVLANHCFKCHGPKKQKGGLRLDSRANVLKGGETGPAIVPGNPDRSRLIAAVNYDAGGLQMPPPGKLKQDDIAALTAWVTMGASWPNDQSTVSATTGTNGINLQERAKHWSLQPIAKQTPPAVKRESWPNTTIDRFILARLERAGLSPASAADKRTLLRRVTYGLIGLPPTPDETEAFLSDDAPDAYERVVDRLLASPHYGERWGRHWLDLVRFAETSGHEADYDIHQAWPYRDYVIRALNQDLPYNQFIIEHIAGDLLNPPRRHTGEGFNESVIGTAFYWFGQGKHSPVDIRAEECDTVDNQIDVLGKTFLGLTVACARCHDHKFDPITTKDYYALAGYLQSSRRQYAFLDAPEIANSITDQLAALKNECRQSIFENAATRLGTSFDRFAETLWETAVKRPHDPLHDLTVSVKQKSPEQFAKVRDDLVNRLREQSRTAAALLESSVVFEDFGRDSYQHWHVTGHAFGPRTTRTLDIFLQNSSGTTVPQLVLPGLAHSGLLSDKLQGVLRSRTFTIEKPFIDYRMCRHGGPKNPGRRLKYGQVHLIVDGFQMIRNPLYGGLSLNVGRGGRFAWFRQDVGKFIGRKAYIEIADEDDGHIVIDQILFFDKAAMPNRPNQLITDMLDDQTLTSLEDVTREYKQLLHESFQLWKSGRLAESDHADDRVEILNGMLQRLFDVGGQLPEAATPNLEVVFLRYRTLESQIKAPRRALAMADGTGENEHVLIRGNHKQPGGEVGRRFLKVFVGDDPPASSVGSGRLELARRIAERSNPLPPRVMVNRLWQHHMGEGLVSTPSDFGSRGSRPTHPELLDWLARRLVESGWRLKPIHRLIMNSAVYMQGHGIHVSTPKIDPENRLLWHRPLRRLEAEAIRDAMLAVSGTLDTRMFGASTLDKGQSRRSIYLTVKRSQLIPILQLFDAPDALQGIDRRPRTTVAPQALHLLNNPRVREYAAGFADRIDSDGTREISEVIHRGYFTALSRPPTQQEEEAMMALIEGQSKKYLGAGEADAYRRFAITDFCQTLICTNEFIYVE